MSLHELVFSKHLEQGETIQYIIHRHWIVALKPFLATILLGIFLPWFLYAIGFNAAGLFWIYFVWTIIALAKLVQIWLDWYADAWVLTNESIIHVEWNGPFHNIGSRTVYEDMQGMTYEIKGFWGTTLRYGDIKLALATGMNVELKTVGNPKGVERTLLNYQSEYLSSKNMRDSTALKDLLSEMLALHMRQK